MCVAALAFDADPDWLLVAIGNRDEFHGRPAAPLARWDSGVIAGRDLQAGGTWLGVSEAGRFALVTNFRADENLRPGALSRGGLVPGWLLGEEAGDPAAKNPFSLFVADRAGLRLITNHPEPAETALAAGIHGLSNGPFAQPWAKTEALRAALADWLAAGDPAFGTLFAALADERELPGPGPEDPRFSPVMIRAPVYGTRCSTVVAIDRFSRGRIEERSFAASGEPTGAVAFDFSWA